MDLKQWLAGLIGLFDVTASRPYAGGYNYALRGNATSTLTRKQKAKRKARNAMAKASRRRNRPHKKALKRRRTRA